MDSEKRFLVYKSSAGSGKTFTLARVYLALALASKDPNYFRHILAITFTVKAATEMKERIVSYLAALAGRPNERKDAATIMELLLKDTGLGQEEIKKRSENVLHAILHSYSDFSVLTIDKFVHRLVRSFSSDLELTPDFEVEIDQARVNDLVVRALLEKTGEHEAITKVILQFMEHQINEDRSWNIESTLLSTADELNSEEFFIRSAEFQALDPSKVMSVKKWLDEQISIFENKLSSLGKEAMLMLEEHQLEARDLYQGQRGIWGYFTAVNDLNYDKVLSPNSYVFQSINDGKWQSGSKKESVLEVSGSLLTLFNRIQQELEGVPEILFYKKLRSAVFTMGLIGEMRNLFTEVKEVDNIQTLTDFYRLLTERFSFEQTPFIYERLGNRFSHILIDEFQDTSTLQWRNLLPLVVNALSEGKQSLIVGDAKQSIYRFRGSEPGQFVNLPYTGSDADLLLEGEYSGHVLDTNYRSAKNVVDFNNRFFEELKFHTLSPELQAVYDDLHQKANTKEPGYVALHTIPNPDGEDRLEVFFREMEGRIAHVVKELQYSQGDICLLFQRNSDASFVAGSLLEAGYQVVSDESLLLYHNPDVNLIIATLYAHRYATDPFRLQQWLARLKQCGHLKHPYHQAAQMLKEKRPYFRQLAKDLGIDFNTARLDTGESFSAIFYLCRTFKLDPGNPFISKLLDFALDFEQNAKFLKHSFLHHWEREAPSLSIELQDAQDAIRIMTIHKSKGLEFHVVFVYLPEIDLTWLTRKHEWITDETGVPLLESALIGTNELKDTPFEELYLAEKERTSLDKVNQLYVAFTRARNHLEIFTEQKNGLPRSDSMQFITTWPEWNAESGTLRLGST